MGDISADLESYIDSVLTRENGEYIVAYTINTNPEEESRMIEDSIENGDGFGFSCAINISDVMKEIGFYQTFTPGGLEKQLQKSEKVKETKVYKNEKE